MLRDLSSQAGAADAEAEVAVIGAGIAGLIVAKRLADAGKRVVVLESGDLKPPPLGDDPANAVEQTATVYAGARDGRVRGLGGTSQAWGGAMLPFLAPDMAAHSAGWGPAWPVALDDLTRHLPWIERLFGLEGGPFAIPPAEAEQLAVPGFEVRAPKWPSFRRRNVATLLQSDLAGPAITVWLNAAATGFQFDPTGNLASVTARHPNGASLNVKARQFVLAAGAIESTRLLLLMNRQADGRLFPVDSPLGRNFHDHLSAPVARLDAWRRSAANKAFAFRFSRGGMRSMRYELTGDARRRDHLPAAFVHLSFSDGGGSGFSALRDLFQAVQRRRLPSARTIGGLALQSPWVARAAYWRFAHKRVLAPAGASFEAHVVTEQAPDADNRITLSERARDALGRPLASIHWRVTPTDRSDVPGGDVAVRGGVAWRTRAFVRLLGALSPRADSRSPARRRRHLPSGRDRPDGARRAGGNRRRRSLHIRGAEPVGRLHRDLPGRRRRQPDADADAVRLPPRRQAGRYSGFGRASSIKVTIA